MKHFLAISAVSLTVLAANGPATAADSPALEKKNITIAVGGSISQMNKVAYFVALNRKYFEQEGLTVESNAFASGTAALQSIVGGSADVAEGAYEHTLRMQTKGVNMTCLATCWWYGNRRPTKSRPLPTLKARRSASRHPALRRRTSSPA
jgi:NitT/TauT family transport system substrate-binding protein